VAAARSSDADETGYEPYALDAEAAEQLWSVSEELVGEHFAWQGANR
jgi:hypothetical protein